ncbi:MAG: Maf family protein [Gammaproteobacteria bacterium]|nr:Maf family protein [Gammaproteobacteria bacterium]
MTDFPPKICLASASPRRQELLQQIGVDFDIMVSGTDEALLPGEVAADYASRLARQKAEDVYRQREERGLERLPTLGADTVVVVDNRILGKPANREDGLAMLHLLAGRTHEVLTAVTIIYADHSWSALQVSRVQFAAMTESRIDEYWASGEPADKAGAYGIQGKAAAYISRLEGSYSGVMGLPLYETACLLQQVMTFMKL